MKKILLMCMAACLCAACGGGGQSLTVTVNNPLDMERSGEMVELPMAEIANRLKLADTARVVVLDAEGEQVPCQITHDDKLIFPVCVAAGASACYTVSQGVPREVEVKACGRAYPERLDDMAWENDLVGFRAYGPALQKSGERGFGYDLFTKYNTTAPVLEEMYAMEQNPESWQKVNDLRRQGKNKEADELVNSFSYHVDHGYGMDCYAVGPTLGAGVAALMVDSSIVYPWCYAEQEVLDNGPLRFSVKLTFHPETVGADTAVVETRVITLDAGSYLNKTVVTYANLTRPQTVVTGIVLHGKAETPNGSGAMDAAAGYMTYVDPTTGPGQGQLFMGAAFPDEVQKMAPVLFSAQEKKARSNADGHILAYSTYEPGSEYVYYWGFAWSKAAIQTMEAWNTYMADFVARVRHPLEVSIAN